jgi:DNA-binding MarR family transcriptional regulator
MSGFTGIFIPQEILMIEELTLLEKVLLSQVIPLSASGECNASNGYLSKRIGVTETTISTSLKSLENKGYLQTFLNRKEGNKRKIEIFYHGDTLFKIFKDPSESNLKTLFKNLKDPLKKSYIPYLNNLKTLFKNLNFIYKEDSKEESKEESKDDNKEKKNDDGDFESFESLADKEKRERKESGAYNFDSLNKVDTAKKLFGDEKVNQNIGRHKLSSKQGSTAIQDFVNFCDDNEKFPRNYQDSRSHFYNWIAKKDINIYRR